MHLIDLKKSFQDVALLEARAAVDYVLAARGENLHEIRQPRPFDVTPEFISALSLVTLSHLVGYENLTHERMFVDSSRKLSPDDTEELMVECLQKNDKIRPRFIPK